jgi:hypothetical protein
MCLAARNGNSSEVFRNCRPQIKCQAAIAAEVDQFDVVSLPQVENFQTMALRTVIRIKLSK